MITKLVRANTKWKHRSLPALGAQRPAQNGRTESCSLWAHRSQPTVGAQRPAHHRRTEAGQLLAQRGRPTVGAPRLAHHGRTEACPPWAHRGRPTVGAQRSAQHERTEACPPFCPLWAHKKPAHYGRIASQIAIAEAQNRRTNAPISTTRSQNWCAQPQACCTEAGPPWAHRGLPTVDAQRPAHFGRKEYRNDSQRLRIRRRTNINHILINLARTNTKWRHKGLPTMGAQRPAHLGRTEGSPL